MKNRRSLRVALTALALALPTLAVAGVPGPTSAAPPAPAAAAKATTVRIMTFNIQYGGEDKEGENLGKIAGVINHYKPSVVLLNEVDRNLPDCKGGECNQAVYLAKLVGMKASYFPIEHKEGKHWRGNAILIRKNYDWVGKVSKTRLQPREGVSCYERGAIRAKIGIGSKRIVVASTHLDFREPRQKCPYNGAAPTILDVPYEQARFLRKNVIRRPSCATFLAGDMNRVPGSKTYNVLTSRLNDVWKTKAAQGNGSTNGFESGGKKKRIDYIFFKHARAVYADVPGTEPDDDFPSDHKPVMATFKVSAGKSC